MHQQVFVQILGILSEIQYKSHNMGRKKDIDISSSTAMEPKARYDQKVHEFIKRMTESNWFNGGIIATIFLNAIIMALETEEGIKDAWGALAFEVMDNTFLAIYTVEFILKIYAEPRKYWDSAYNVFDFIVLALSYIQVVMQAAELEESKLGALKVLRSLRTLRTLRTVSFIKGLQVLVTALVDTIRKWVINIIMLLLLLIFLFAIMGYYFFGYQSEDVDWNTLGRAMLTLFSFVTVDGWTELQDKLDERGYYMSRIYTIVFIVIGHFIFTNVFIGVIIMNISEATEAYKREQMQEREAVLKHKKEFMMMRQHRDVKQMMERQKRGNYTNFHDMVREFQRSLSHDDSIMMTDLCTNIIWIETFLRTLDHMDSTTYRVQQLHFELANTLTRTLEAKLRHKYGA